MMRFIPVLYARLLRLYPQAFRERFGDEMQYVFDQAWGAARQHGLLAAFGFCLRECLGLVISILSSRMAEQRGRVLSGLMFNPRIMLPVLAVICAIPAATLSLGRWGYLFAPPSPDAVLAPLHQIDSFQLVQFDAAYQPHVIPLTQFPHTTVTDYPPTRILPLVQSRLNGVETATTLDPQLSNQLAEALSAQGLEAVPPPVDYPTEPHYCVPRSDLCFADPALLPPSQFYSFKMGVQVQADGAILKTVPLFEVDENHAVTVTGEAEYWATPQDGWSYYSHFLPGGFVIQGRDAAGKPLVFASLASSRITGGDQYRYYEFLFGVEGDSLQVRAENRYGFDVAGLEGMTFPVITLIFWVPLILVWLVLMALWRLSLWVSKTWAARRSLV